MVRSSKGFNTEFKDLKIEDVFLTERDPPIEASSDKLKEVTLKKRLNYLLKISGQDVTVQPCSSV